MILSTALAMSGLLVGGAAPADDAATAHAERRGQALAYYDRAASVASDDLLSRLPSNRQAEVGRWIVTPGTAGLHVDFFGQGAVPGAQSTPLISMVGGTLCAGARGQR